ncbi:hypothetical protein JTF08_16420 [Micrococcaceae bacterium RIT802]|nr:hypothetical protein [Micrococcaceae bacterium RIT 802]
MTQPISKSSKRLPQQRTRFVYIPQKGGKTSFLRKASAVRSASRKQDTGEFLLMSAPLSRKVQSAQDDVMQSRIERSAALLRMTLDEELGRTTPESVKKIARGAA